MVSCMCHARAARLPSAETRELALAATVDCGARAAVGSWELGASQGTGVGFDGD